MAQSFKKIKIETDEPKIKETLGVKEFNDPTDSKAFLDSSEVLNKDMKSEPGSIDRLATQKDNLEARLEAVDRKYDPRNTMQKLLGLKENHGLISGSLDLLVRPLGVVKSVVNEAINPTEEGFTGALMSGIKGDGRDLNWVTMAGLDTGHLDGFSKFLMNFGLDIAGDPLTWIPAGAMWKGMKKVGAGVKKSGFFQAVGHTVLGDRGMAKVREAYVGVANSFGKHFSFMFGSTKDVKELASKVKASQAEMEQQLFAFIDDIHTLRADASESLYRYIKHNEVPDTKHFPNLVKYAEGKEKTVRETFDELLEYMGIRNYDAHWRSFVKEKHLGNEAVALNDRITWLTGLDEAGKTVDEFMLKKATEFLNIRYGREFGMSLPKKSNIRKLIAGYQKEFEQGLLKDFSLYTGMNGKEKIERAYAEYIGRAAFKEGVGSVDKRTIETIMKALQSDEGAFFAVDPEDIDGIADLLEDIHLTIGQEFDKERFKQVAKQKADAKLMKETPEAPLVKEELPKTMPQKEIVKPTEQAYKNAKDELNTIYTQFEKDYQVLNELVAAYSPGGTRSKPYIDRLTPKERNLFFAKYPKAKDLYDKVNKIEDKYAKLIKQVKNKPDTKPPIPKTSKVTEDTFFLKSELNELHEKRKALEAKIVGRPHYGSKMEMFQKNPDMLELYKELNFSKSDIYQAGVDAKFINNWKANYEIYSHPQPQRALEETIDKSIKGLALNKNPYFGIVDHTRKRVAAYKRYEKFFNDPANKGIPNEQLFADFTAKFRKNLEEKFTAESVKNNPIRESFKKRTLDVISDGEVDKLPKRVEAFIKDFNGNAKYGQKLKNWDKKRANFKNDLAKIKNSWTPVEYTQNLKAKTTDEEIEAITKYIHQDILKKDIIEDAKIGIESIDSDINWLRPLLERDTENLAITKEYYQDLYNKYKSGQKVNKSELRSAQEDYKEYVESVKEIKQMLRDKEILKAKYLKDIEEFSKIAESKGTITLDVLPEEVRPTSPDLEELDKINKEIERLNKLDKLEKLEKAAPEAAVKPRNKKAKTIAQLELEEQDEITKAIDKWKPGDKYDNNITQKLKQAFQAYGIDAPTHKYYEDWHEYFTGKNLKQSEKVKELIKRIDDFERTDQTLGKATQESAQETYKGPQIEETSDSLFSIESTEDYGLKHFKALERLDSRAWQTEPELRKLLNYYGNIENVKDAFLANKGKGIILKWDKSRYGKYGKEANYFSTEMWLRNVEQLAKEQALLKITNNFEEMAEYAAKNGIKVETYPLVNGQVNENALYNVTHNEGTNWNKVFKTEIKKIKESYLNEEITLPQYITTDNVGYLDARFIDSLHILNNTIYRFIEEKGFTTALLENSSYLKNVINPEQTMLAATFKTLHSPRGTKAAQMTSLDKTLKGNLPSSVFQDSALYSADVMNKILGFDLYASDQVLAIARQSQVLPEQFSFWSIVRDSIKTGTEFKVVDDATRVATDILDSGVPVNKIGRTYIGVDELQEKLEHYHKFVPEEDWLQVETLFESITSGGAVKDPYNPDKLIKPQYVEISLGLKDLIERPAKTMQEVDTLGDFFSKVIKPWKATLLVTPGYHARNIASNALNASAAGLPMAEYSAKYFQATTDVVSIQNTLKLFIEGASESAKNYNFFRTVTDLENYAKTLVSGKDFELWKEWIDLSKRGVLNQSRISSDFWDYINAIGNVGKKQKWHQNAMKKLFDANMHLGQMADDAARWATYRIGIENPKYFKNLDLDSADSLVKFIHFDYNALTEFEKGVMKKWIPFYTWSRKNLEFQIKATLRNPERATRVQKFINALYTSQFMPEELNQNELPEWINENMWFPVRGKNNKIKYIKINPPIQDFIDLGNLKILSRVNPFYKITLETMTGTDLFNNQNTTFTKSIYNNLLSPFTKFLASPFDIPVGQIPVGGDKTLGGIMGQDINFLEKNSIWFTQDIDDIKKSYYWEQINGMSNYIDYLQSEGYNIPASKDLIKNQTIPKAIVMPPLKTYKVKKLKPLQFK